MEMNNIQQSVEPEWKIIWRFLEFAKHENGKTIEQTYTTPFLGYPYYSRHDDLVNNLYHNDDCPPMRGFYRWHVMDPVFLMRSLRLLCNRLVLDIKVYLNVRMICQVLHTGIRRNHIMFFQSFLRKKKMAKIEKGAERSIDVKGKNASGN